MLVICLRIQKRKPLTLYILQSWKSFGSLNKVVRAKQSNKTRDINIDRQIFSQLAVIGQSRDLDLSDLMEYELAAPVPVSLFHLDGTMRKNNKSDADVDGK